ncbi:hypothetical protein VOLCADRAFT_86809 [Volvox carteri f. nagariensis]|uniref:Uncharacterized protein n=1 Tax=Volvox carteri f. nagariensis TaxID=3068 RepID=D8TJN5_VOLCA|nr:uncharacterized protein VOLCADRAFT_86809 [Volvox carteri f. nagariensis]EFJ52403.1 hypothetical protein VOLCADRAFT_86809 [Volvox carteri f. nagariensis]|eukprot:XP_002946476.1 hypothetical protein VOLCADRAFT_86809 [Volvox carteri f. nagariensis]
MPPVTRAVHNQERGIGEDFRPGAASSDYSDDCYDHDSDEDDITVEPGVSCLPRAPGADKPTSASGRTSATHGSSRYRAEATSVFRQTAGRSSAGVDVRSLARSGRGPSDLTDRLGRVTLNEPVGCTSRLSHLEEIGGKLGRKDLEAAGRLSSSGVQRPGSATAAKDQHRKPNGPTLVMPFDRDTHTLRHRRVKEDDDDEGDVAFSDPDKEHTAHAASMEDLGWLPPGGRTGAPGKSAQNPYPAWLAGVEGPVDARLADALLAQGQLSPQESTRSFASRATSRCSIGSKRGAKKVDRVQRYQQLQQEWSQNSRWSKAKHCILCRFLKQAGGTSRGTSRKPINFHSHFASLHAAEEAERQRMLRETRARTKKELGAATEAPTANRRDELRWQTRMRLREQT